MDRSETLKIMAVLRGAYPQFYRNIGRTEAEDTVNLWKDIFSSYEYTLVSAAVKSFIEADEKGFPPVPGQIAEKIRLIVSPQKTAEAEAAEAWAKVAEAVKNGLYGYREEFEKLPELSKRIVARPEQLRDWAMMDSNSVHSVVASNFQRAYRTACAREAEIAKLPVEVRKMISGAYNCMALEVGDD